MERHGSCLCLPLTPPVPAAAAWAWDSQAGEGHRRCPAAPSPEPSRGAGTARGSQESSVVEELLRNSLDKAYGKEGNVHWPGRVKGHAAPLPGGLELPQPRQLPGLPGLGRCAWPRGCWGSPSVGCWAETQGGRSGAQCRAPCSPCCSPVLTWAGEASAVSQDAIRDAAWARSRTVIDEWDEEFDRGKVGAGRVLGRGAAAPAL